jgi:hypothetical protein
MDDLSTNVGLSAFGATTRHIRRALFLNVIHPVFVIHRWQMKVVILILRVEGRATHRTTNRASWELIPDRVLARRASSVDQMFPS